MRPKPLLGDGGVGQQPALRADQLVEGIVGGVIVVGAIAVAVVISRKRAKGTNKSVTPDETA